MGVETAFGTAIDMLSNRVPRPVSEYMGEDGFLHCSVCHRATQMKFVVEELGIERVVRCICDCEIKQMEEYEAT